MSVEGNPDQGAPAGGNRRIDRVLADDYLDHLGQAELAEVRTLRTEAEQEEVDLSYLRRMVQGRIDVVRAELDRREGRSSGGAAGASLVDGLADILADEPRAPARGLGRHTTLEPTRTGEHRRYVEALVADVGLSDVSTRSSDELVQAKSTLSEQEQLLSSKRRAVQVVMDACSAEITRRYRDGEADVATLLGEQPTGA